jgi:hypothetical protein
MSTIFSEAGIVRSVSMKPWISSSRAIGHVDDADVRLDRAERVVRALGPGGRDGVENGGLADVGQSDDAAGETHGFAPVFGARSLLRHGPDFEGLQHIGARGEARMEPHAPARSGTRNLT